MGIENTLSRKYRPLQEFKIPEKTVEKRSHASDDYTEIIQSSLQNSGGIFSQESIFHTNRIIRDTFSLCKTATEQDTPAFLIQPLATEKYGSYFLGIVLLNSDLIVRLNEDFVQSRTNHKPRRINFLGLTKWGKTAAEIKATLAHEVYHNRQWTFYPSRFDKSVVASRLWDTGDQTLYETDRGERAANAFAARYLKAEATRLRNLQRSGKSDFKNVLLTQELYGVLNHPLYSRDNETMSG